MNFSVWFLYIVAVVTAGITVIALYRDPHSFVHRIFAAGMGLFALDTGLSGLMHQSQSLDAFLFWYRMELISTSFIPGFWMIFSLSFARANYSEQLAKWKWLLIAAFVLPLSMSTVFYNTFFADQTIREDTSALFIRIEWPGYIWYLLWVIFAVLILMNLERTFRHSTGHMRWQTKFMFLGIAGIFGVHLFTNSQIILFKTVSNELEYVDFGALLVADILILRSFFRGKPLHVGMHISHQFLYSSFTTLIVGIYFISVGVFSWIFLHFEWLRNINLIIFLIFIAVVGLAAILLSDRLRMRRKRFISKHFKRPQYDYQIIWEDFTRRTASVTQTKELCNIIVRMVSESMEILSVSIWLVDEKQERLSFGGSTVFTAEQAQELKFSGQGGTDLIRAMIDQTKLVDLLERDNAWVEDLKRTYEFETKESQIRYCIPLNAAGHLIGIMMLSEKVFYVPLTFEESELVKTIADQAAAALLNLRLAERLRQAKELEAFQSMSAFFMHDLKNLASKLSLVTQNLPVHLDNPEFRNDTLQTIEQSVAKINTMNSRLSLLSQKFDLVLKTSDLNELVAETVSDTQKYVKAPVAQNLDTVPPLYIDQEQIHKVLENLLMNASDALGEDGQITVSTRLRYKLVEISVHDNGCGISKEFIEKKLFRPFQTSKKQGMGIGLYHCKTIIEAHGGRIEVESDEGKGSTFRVLLPLNSK